MEQARLLLDGHEAYSIVFSRVHVHHGLIKQKQYGFYIGATLYTLTCTARSDTFDRDLSTADGIMRSLHIRK